MSYNFDQLTKSLFNSLSNSKAENASEQLSNFLSSFQKLFCYSNKMLSHRDSNDYTIIHCVDIDMHKHLPPSVVRCIQYWNRYCLENRKSDDPIALKILAAPEHLQVVNADTGILAWLYENMPIQTISESFNNNITKPISVNVPMSDEFKFNAAHVKKSVAEFLMSHPITDYDY
jgi:hypothetical protein